MKLKHGGTEALREKIKDEIVSSSLILPPSSFIYLTPSFSNDKIIYTLWRILSFFGVLLTRA